MFNVERKGEIDRGDSTESAFLSRAASATFGGSFWKSKKVSVSKFDKPEKVAYNQVRLMHTPETGLIRKLRLKKASSVRERPSMEAFLEKECETWS
jgi:hypothetical protein